MEGIAKAAIKMAARVVFNDVLIVLIRVEKKRAWIMERESLIPPNPTEPFFVPLPARRIAGRLGDRLRYTGTALNLQPQRASRSRRCRS
jgi:hypothetical protein